MNSKYTEELQSILQYLSGLENRIRDLQSQISDFQVVFRKASSTTTAAASPPHADFQLDAERAAELPQVIHH